MQKCYMQGFKLHRFGVAGVVWLHSGGGENGTGDLARALSHGRGHRLPHAHWHAYWSVSNKISRWRLSVSTGSSHDRLNCPLLMELAREGVLNTIAWVHSPWNPIRWLQMEKSQKQEKIPKQNCKSVAFLKLPSKSNATIKHWVMFY